MTLAQRAQQFWSVLMFAAKEQKVISYSMLSQMTGFPEASDMVLHYIYCYCKQYHLPPLTVIVINPATGRPGDQFPSDFFHLSAQQSSVFLFDWLNRPVPSDDMFEAAMAKEEELETANAGYIALPC